MAGVYGLLSVLLVVFVLGLLLMHLLYSIFACSDLIVGTWQVIVEKVSFHEAT